MISGGAVAGARDRVTLTGVAAGALALFAFTIPIEEIWTIPMFGSPARLAGLIAFPLGIVALFQGGRLRFRKPLLFLVVAAAFYVWNVASFYWSHDQAATVRMASRFLQLAVVIWLITEHCREQDRQFALMHAFVLGNYAAFGLTAYSILVEPTGVFRDTGRFNANEFAINLALAIPMAMLLLSECRSRMLRVATVMFPLVATFGVVLAASRTGLIVCIVALAVIPFSLKRLDVVRRMVVLLAVLSALVFSFGIAPVLYPDLRVNVERLQETSDEITTGTMTGRTTIWRAAWSVFRESPVLGVGSGAVPGLIAVSEVGRRKTVHNTLLSVASETGVIGLLLFLALVAVAVTSATLAMGRHRPYFLVLCAALLISMVPGDSEARKDSWFVLTLLALHRPITVSLDEGRGHWPRP